MEVLAWFFFWIVCAVVAGIVASNKNRLALAWALWTLLLSPLLLLILLALPRKEPSAPPAIASKSERMARQPVRFSPQPAPAERFVQPEAAADTKACPECAETVKAAAKVCRFCGYRFDGATA